MTEEELFSLFKNLENLEDSLSLLSSVIQCDVFKIRVKFFTKIAKKEGGEYIALPVYSIYKDKEKLKINGFLYGVHSEGYLTKIEKLIQYHFSNEENLRFNFIQVVGFEKKLTFF